MTYALVTPYLKGLHLMLVAFHPGQDCEGWKLTPHEWAAYLYELVETGKISTDEAESMQEAVEEITPPLPMGSPLQKPPPKPPTMVSPVGCLKDDVEALTVLFDQDEPTQKLTQASRVYTILYGFADASGQDWEVRYWEKTVSDTGLTLGTRTPKSLHLTSESSRIWSTH